MSGEESLLAYVRARMKRMAHVVKHHDDWTPGISDLSLFLLKERVTRWVELKAEADWPKRTDTPLHLDCYTEAQALFLRTRDGFLLVRVKSAYMLFSAATAWELWESGGWPRHIMLNRAVKVWYRFILWKEFKEALLRG